MSTHPNFSLYVLFMKYIMYIMKIHVPSMLAIGIDKYTQQTNK